ncbi:MAG: MerR family transcriptional regulator [Candidatus Binatia bacterium]
MRRRSPVVGETQAPLPDKFYFKIGEVAAIVGVQPYVLRYWESEFSVVKPSKTRSKHRLYRRKDIEALLQIKRLLHEERFTIEGARKRLRKLHKERRLQTSGEQAYRNILLHVKKEVESLYRLLC